MLNDVQRFGEAINRTPADKELRREGYYDEERSMKEKAKIIPMELAKYFGSL